MHQLNTAPAPAVRHISAPVRVVLPEVQQARRRRVVREITLGVAVVAVPSFFCSTDLRRGAVVTARVRSLTPTEPIDVSRLLAADPPHTPHPTREPRSPAGARADRRQWHRRGMRSPDEIAAIVHERLYALPTAVVSPDNAELPDPAYGDFFLEPRA